MVTEIVAFPFKNSLNQKINEITIDILEAILAAQSNQNFFMKLVLEMAIKLSAITNPETKLYT